MINQGKGEQNKIQSHQGISPMANIPTFATGEQAPRCSHLVCEPDSATLRLRKWARSAESTKKHLYRLSRGVFWHSQRESNSQLTLRRGLLYPFNYGSVVFNYAFDSANGWHAYILPQRVAKVNGERIKHSKYIKYKRVLKSGFLCDKIIKERFLSHRVT